MLPVVAPNAVTRAAAACNDLENSAASPLILPSGWLKLLFILDLKISTSLYASDVLILRFALIVVAIVFL